MGQAYYPTMLGFVVFMDNDFLSLRDLSHDDTITIYTVRALKILSVFGWVFTRQSEAEK